MSAYRTVRYPLRWLLWDLAVALVAAIARKAGLPT